jgi:hypothetical protein
MDYENDRFDRVPIPIRAVAGLCAASLSAAVVARIFALVGVIMFHIWATKPLLEVSLVSFLLGFYCRAVRLPPLVTVLTLAISGYVTTLITFKISAEDPTVDLIGLLQWAVVGVPIATFAGLFGVVSQVVSAQGRSQSRQPRQKDGDLGVK